MSKYLHGINLVEKPTSIPRPKESYSSVQVIIGTAPINLSDDISAVVNKAIKVTSYDEAIEKLGYSDDWDSYTLCEAIDANFKELKVAPIVFINVLDPEVHKKDVKDTNVTLKNGTATLEQEGILLDSIVLKSTEGNTIYVKGTDYIVSFNSSGHVVINGLSESLKVDTIQTKADFKKLDPTAVTELDIIGGYDDTKNQFKGAELIKTIYPMLRIVPNSILAPKFSLNANVAAVLSLKSRKINGCFNATVIVDVNGNTKEEAKQNKEDNYLNENNTFVCWPKVKMNKKTYRFSTILGAAIALRDADNNFIPSLSPSNLKLPLESAVNDSGQEVFLDQVEGNVLNGTGIVTVVNMGGWRVWGNRTAAYNPNLGDYNDPKDTYIPVRRMFDWWGNTFIQEYFDRLDKSISYKWIESLVDSDNVRANGLRSSGYIAGGSISFDRLDNPLTEILNGRVNFKQKLAFYTPGEYINNELEYDTSMLMSEFGGAN